MKMTLCCRIKGFREQFFNDDYQHSSVKSLCISRAINNNLTKFHINDVYYVACKPITLSSFVYIH